jgi:hypothetical protein
MPKFKTTPYVSSIGQYAKEQEAKRYPDGPFWEQPKLTWYRAISDNGAVRWCFSGNREQQEFYAQVEDTGKSFRWSVGFDDPVDEGYTRTLSLAKLKAEKLWHELTDSVAEELAKEQDNKRRGLPL